MALPTFRSLAARRQQKENDGVTAPEDDSERTVTPTYTPAVNIKAATKIRKIFIWISCFLFALCVIFLILVCANSTLLSTRLIDPPTIIGNINNKPVIRSTYFYKLDLTNIIPSSADNIILVNSLARSLGLHDFYQVGLWNFCEGYNNEGITHCSSPQSLYWFNPVEVLLNELLSGATIALPAEITNILKLIRIASHVMFGFYLTGICMNFFSIFLAPLALRSRWWSLPLIIWTFIAALLTVTATIIATVMAVIFRNVATSQAELNIGADIGTTMFAFMWIGAGSSLIGFLLHLGMSCCCASRRDVRTGRRKGRLGAYGDAASGEKKRPLNKRHWAKVPIWGRMKTSGEVV